MANTMLKVSNLKVAYGGIQAVKGVTFEVYEGELVSLIGANGAGKTTTLKAVTGTQPTVSGEIEFMGQSIKGRGPWDLVKQGLVMVPEGRGTFTRMTITENLQMGAFIRNDNAQIEADIDKVFAIFPRLKERRHQLAGTNSSSTSRIAVGAPAGPATRALTSPGSRLAPSELETTGPRQAAAAARSLVVVDLPFVPETRTTVLPAVSSRSAVGRSRRTTWPGTVPPPPRPVSRDSRPAVRPSAKHARA